MAFTFQTSALVTITIDDVNDNAPVFKKPSYQTSIREVRNTNLGSLLPWWKVSSYLGTAVLFCHNRNTS